MKIKILTWQVNVQTLDFGVSDLEKTLYPKIDNFLVFKEYSLRNSEKRG